MDTYDKVKELFNIDTDSFRIYHILKFKSTDVGEECLSKLVLCRNLKSLRKAFETYLKELKIHQYKDSQPNTIELPNGTIFYFKTIHQTGLFDGQKYNNIIFYD